MTPERLAEIWKLVSIPETEFRPLFPSSTVTELLIAIESLTAEIATLTADAMLQREQKLEREWKLIDILNGMVKRLKPIHYSDFNREFVAQDADSLADFEKLHSEVGLKVIRGGDDVQLGTSTLAIIATITDVLTGRRLSALVTQDDETIIGFQWFIPPGETTDGRPFEITMNGKTVQHTTESISYDDIFQWYSMGRTLPAETLLTITYSGGPASNPSGSIVRGGQVQIRDGMIFNAAITG